MLERFGKLAAIALDNARLYQSAQAEIDQRRRTEEELLDTVARLSRSELELKRAHEETIRRLADAAEFRDADTGRHTERMSRYCELLARRLGLDEERCDLIRVASPLHDIGKIAVPDGILLKAGPSDRGRAARDGAAHRGRVQADVRIVVGAPGCRGDDRVDAPRAVRRQGVSARSRR